MGDWIIRSGIHLTYWGIEPPSDWNGTRARRQSYSDSVVALDADTGKLKWHYQFSPHDEFDTMRCKSPSGRSGVAGRARKVCLGESERVLYVLDRTTGQFLMANLSSK